MQVGEPQALAVLGVALMTWYIAGALRRLLDRLFPSEVPKVPNMSARSLFTILATYKRQSQALPVVIRVGDKLVTIEATSLQVDSHGNEIVVLTPSEPLQRQAAEVIDIASRRKP